MPAVLIDSRRECTFVTIIVALIIEINECHRLEITLSLFLLIVNFLERLKIVNLIPKPT